MLLTESMLRDIEKAEKKHNSEYYNNTPNTLNTDMGNWKNSKKFKNMPIEARKAMLKGYDAYQEYMNNQYEEDNDTNGNRGTPRNTKGFKWLHPFSWEAKRANEASMFGYSNLNGIREVDEDEEERSVRMMWDAENNRH